MLFLTSEDMTVIESLARECSREGEENEITEVLVHGFSYYGEDEFLRDFPSREEYFRGKYRLLLENIGFAGQTFEWAFASKDGRDWLCQMVRGQGVPNSDIEDIVQEISRKWWKARWVERYNPLISSWRNFLLVPIQRYVKTYRVNQGKKVTSGAFPLDAENEQDKYGNTAASCLYDLGQEGSPEDSVIRQEVMEDWESFLESQPPIRTAVRRDFDRLCTLLPPGITDIPTEEEKTIFFLRGGYYNSRVMTEELENSCMVPNQLLVDYITEDPVTHEQCIDEITGDFVTQKDYPNPNYDPSIMVKQQRTWMDLYKLLMEGFQVEEIAHALKMAPPSVPARIQRLESLFRSFWLISTKVPTESKILAVKTYQCPNCDRLDRNQREECSECGEDMRNVKPEMRFNAYPWPKVYVTRQTFERLGTRRQAMIVQKCSISIRV